MANSSPSREIDYVIVGAGPGGLQLGYFFAKNGFDYLILEARHEAGSFFRTFPRHRRLISINKVHTGRKDPAVRFRWDWNSLLNDERRLFADHSQEYFPHADAMVAYLRDFAAANELRVEYDRRVRRISRHRDRFLVETPSETLGARHVIVATGLSEPHVPAVAGIEHAGNYASFDTDPGRYANRRVLVIGKGNSGFETAESLIPFAAQIHVVGPTPVKHAWNTHHVGHLRAVNNNLIDTDHLKGQNATIWGELRSIEVCRGQYRVRISHTDSKGGVFTHVYDDIICCAGFRMNREIFDPSADPEVVIDGRLPKLTAEWESTNVENLFFVGTLTQSRDYRRSSSAFIHGFRYNARALFDMLSRRRGGRWPSRTLAAGPEAVTNALMARINTASSLWHQFNLMSDVLDLSAAGVEHYYDVPVDYALTAEPFRFPRSLILTFTHDKPRDPRLIEQFSQEPALHPVVRLVERGEVVSEHHVLEDLDAEWFEDGLYIQPLESYVAGALSEPHSARNAARPTSTTGC